MKRKCPDTEKLEIYVEWALNTTLEKRRRYWKNLKQKYEKEGKKKLNDILPPLVERNSKEKGPSILEKIIGPKTLPCPSIPVPLGAREKRSKVEDAGEKKYFIPGPVLDIEGSYYKSLINADGDVFLRPCPRPEYTHLQLGGRDYLLEPLRDDIDLCKVDGLSSKCLREYTTTAAKDPRKQPLTFIRRT
jgi:hypothetical protein